MPWIDPPVAREAIRNGRGKGVRIAILDSGIDIAHPKFGDRTLADDVAIVVDASFRLQTVQGCGQDAHGHGTAVAGIIHELAPEAEIGSFRVLSEHLHSRSLMILAGAREAINRGYHIINCSLGGRIREHCLIFKTWVDEAYLSGVHIVAACNNFDPAKPEWPAHFTSVNSVNMANTGDDALYRNPGETLVEFAAHGADVEVAWAGGATSKMTGSSFAAPRVTAMLARLLSEIPGIPPLPAKSLLQALAAPLTPHHSPEAPHAEK